MTDPVDTDPQDVDPEDIAGPDPEELREREADVVDEFDRPLPVEANEADVVEQKQEVPADDDDYDR
jgi:hypothetical protein